MIPALLAPIEQGNADFVLGSRLLGEREPGSLTPAQIVAGRLAGLLIRLLYGVRFTDMSPFRAIRRDALDRLGMREETFGWNLEMQMRVAAAGLRAIGGAGGAAPASGRGVEGVRQLVWRGVRRVRPALDFCSLGVRFAGPGTVGLGQDQGRRLIAKRSVPPRPSGRCAKEPADGWTPILPAGNSVRANAGACLGSSL